MQIITLEQYEFGRLLQFNVDDMAGNPINISGSTARFRFWNATNGTIFDKICAITDPINGVVQYTILANDLTGSAGQYYGELEVASAGRRFFIDNYIVQLNQPLPSGSM